MNWLQKLPNTIRSATGLEWTVWRQLPRVTAIGTALPLLCLLALHLASDPVASAAQSRWLQMADYMVYAIVIFHWTMVLTVAIGCIVVMVMKGPAYVADGYKVSHSDSPRQRPQTREEVANYRSPD